MPAAHLPAAQLQGRLPAPGPHPPSKLALLVVDMHGRKTLALQSVSGERAVEAERVLASLVEQRGAPLVLELD